eukprot:UN00009
MVLAFYYAYSWIWLTHYVYEIIKRNCCIRAIPCNRNVSMRRGSIAQRSDGYQNTWVFRNYLAEKDTQAFQKLKFVNLR